MIVNTTLYKSYIIPLKDLTLSKKLWIKNLIWKRTLCNINTTLNICNNGISCLYFKRTSFLSHYILVISSVSHFPAIISVTLIYFVNFSFQSWFLIKQKKKTESKRNKKETEDQEHSFVSGGLVFCRRDRDFVVVAIILLSYALISYLEETESRPCLAMR